MATLADVAAAVGLSPAAVSLALRGKPGVSETTRQRVVEASRSLGYRPISGTRPAITRSPLTVTLVIRALHGDSPGANRFYGPVLAGVEERCRRLHIRLMLAIMPVDQYNHPIEVPHSVTDRLSDGLIFVGAHFASAMSPLLRGRPTRGPGRCLRRGRGVRRGRDGQHPGRKGRGRAPREPRTPQHRHPRHRAQRLPEHPAAAARLRAGDGRSRPDCRTTSTRRTTSTKPPPRRPSATCARTRA